MIRLVLLSVLVLCSLSSTLTAQAESATDYPRKLSFLDILKNRDIALGEVLSVTQDHNGFMWFGGRNKMVRFDGYDFIEVKTPQDAKTPNAENEMAPLTWIFTMLVDSNNNLWAGTRDGLYLLDRDTNVMQRVQPENQALTQVNVIQQMASGEIVVGTYNGFAVLDTNGNSKQTLGETPLPDDVALLLPNPTVHALASDANNNLWLGTGVGLSLYNTTDGSVKNFTPFPEDATSLGENEIWTIAIDHQQIIWLGTHNGAYRFNPITEVFTRYIHDDKNANSLGGNYVWDIGVDHNGWVWLCTDSGGISLYDAINDRFIPYDNSKSQIDSLKYSSTRTIFEDKIGDLWVTTFPAGINFYDRSTAAFDNITAAAGDENGLSDTNVWTLVEDHQGDIWLGTSGGVDRYNSATGEFTSFTAQNGGIAINNLIASHVDSKGRVWMGTWEGGLHLFSKEKNKFEVIPFAPELINTGKKVHNKLIGKTIWSIREDADGMIWLGMHNAGLAKYDTEKGEFTHYVSNNADPETLSNQLVWTTFEDSRGNFWIGTVGGLNLFDKKAGKVKKQFFKDEGKEGALNSESILSIFEDSLNRLWFGTNAGLHLYNYDTSSFTFYGTKDGFADMSIRSILEDPSKNLWLSTNNGVVRFNPDSKKVSNFKTYNGQLIGSFNTGAGLKTSKGELMFGGVTGWRIYHVNKLKSNDYIPPVQITNLSLYTKPVDVSDDTGLLSKVINQTNEVVFNYTQNMFSLNFSALNYRDSNKNTYAYKLDGFDSDWRVIGNQRKAQYTNLSPGKYTFRVKASNNDGVWNEQGVSLQIVQLPPPWKTWWAYTIYALITLGLIANFIYKQRLKRKLIEEQNRLLEIKVAERTSEIAAKNKNIQSMLINMRQGLFTVEANGCIHSEYSAHLEEIFATKNIAGRNAADMLFSNATLGSDTINQAQEGLKAIIGEDEMNYTFNVHVLPTEYSIKNNDKIQYLSLSWDPIVNDDIVEKLMVSVRDVTALKETEAAAEVQRRELAIITQILAVEDKKYRDLIKTTHTFIEENREKILTSDQASDDVIALLFRNMHTVKGNCRTYGFKYLTDVVHDVEDYYSQLKRDSSVWNKTRLLDDLLRVEDAFSEYHNVYENILGRGTEIPAITSNVSPEVLTAVHNYLNRATQESPQVASSNNVKSAKVLIEISQSETLTNILKDITLSTPDIAKQLNKPAPNIIINDYNIRIKEGAQNLLTNVFAHLIRNSIDHGIEVPEAREVFRKPPQGTIRISTIENDGKLAITISDDGQGLNMRRLYAQGVAMGRWQDGDDINPKIVADLIFASGASTKEEISSISGRGVGMDAVKQFISNMGGDIELKLDEGDNQLGDYIHFETVIYLPKPLYFAIGLH